MVNPESPGELIAWYCTGKVKQVDLVAALRDSGLPEKAARDRLPRHAFARACQKMSEQRIIRPVSDANGYLEFQFTKEIVDTVEKRLSYDFEAVLRADKDNGKVTCREEPGLAVIAQDELNKAMDERTGADITRLIQRLFRGQADLFPVRPQGGCYFVPARHVGFIDQVKIFATRLGVDLRRIPLGRSDEGSRSLRRVVAEGIEGLIDDHRKSIEEFDADTRESTLARAASKIRETRFKIEAYGEYLDEERQRLLDSLTDQEKALDAKLAEAVAA